MNNFQLHTHRLSLIPFTIPMLEAMKDGAETFFQLTSYNLPQKFTEFPDSIDYMIEIAKTNKQDIPWASFAIILNSEQTYAGQCGFKSSPDHQGQVEFGYEIAEQYRLKGLANEVIRILIDLAFGYSEINGITAHTLAEQNISNHLLVKNGFVFVQSLLDETDGKIWKWSLSRKVYQLRKLWVKDK